MRFSMIQSAVNATFSFLEAFSQPSNAAGKTCEAPATPPT
jgi:hypothetical protein